MTHPYRAFPLKAFWSRSVARNFDPAEIYEGERPLLRAGMKVVSAGSCFAANLVPFLERNGFTYVKTESGPPLLGLPGENLSYGKFSAAYGNMYTPRQLKQLLLRALGRFAPAEDRWYENRAVIDAFRPGLRYPARDDAEFDLLTRAHLKATHAAIAECEAFIFTLGLTEAWVSRIDGAVYPACPGTLAGTFDPEKHEFVNIGVAETIADTIDALNLVREINPGVRIVLTVSPVPLVATATGGHVLASTIYSKSVLRVAAAEAAKAVPNTVYFPAYEIVTGPQAPESFFEPDRRDVSQEAIATVMRSFFAACELADSVPPAAPAAANQPKGDLSALAARIAQIECEEAAADL